MFHVELAPLGGIFGPLKSDLGVFWPFRGTDFIMGKNKNANFSKSPHGPIFKFCVVIREAILQKMAPILDPVNFFLVLTLLGHCGAMDASLKSKLSLLMYSPFYQGAICSLLIPLHHQCYWSNTLNGPDRSNYHLRWYKNLNHKLA